jgi:hypothetical protein
MSVQEPPCPECRNHDQVASYVVDERSHQKTQTGGLIVNFSDEPVLKWSCKRCGKDFSTPA